MRRLILPAIVSAIAFVILCGLGIWQLERLYEKEALLKRIDQSLKTDPVAMPPEAEWPALKPDDYSYRKITVNGEFDHKHEAHLFGFIVTDSKGGSAPGYFVLTPLTLQDGSRVIVNRGFVPQEKRDPTTRSDGLLAGEITVTGLMRSPEDRNWFTPADNPTERTWFTRDPAANGLMLVELVQGTGQDLVSGLVRPQVFRFGASGIYDDIARVLGGADTAHAAGSSDY